MGNNSARKKILIIDDEKGFAEILKASLEAAHKFAVDIAADGKGGLEKIRENRPDLVILDLILPGLPGEEVCREIRRCEKTEKLPIIMLTAKASDADKVIGKVIGANTYLIKPVKMRELMEEIERLVG